LQDCRVVIVITQDRGHTIVLDGLTQGYSRYRADILQSLPSNTQAVSNQNVLDKPEYSYKDT
jgi:hypothetical protein